MTFGSAPPACGLRGAAPAPHPRAVGREARLARAQDALAACASRLRAAQVAAVLGGAVDRGKLERLTLMLRRAEVEAEAAFAAWLAGLGQPQPRGRRRPCADEAAAAARHRHPGAGTAG